MIHATPRAIRCLIATVALLSLAQPASPAIAQPAPARHAAGAGKNDCRTCNADTNLRTSSAPAIAQPVFRTCDAFQTPRANGYPCGQCTWWAAYLRPDIPTSSALWPRPAHASMWDDNWRALGLATTAVPEPGAIAVFEPEFVKNDEGHVAYVVAAAPIRAGAVTYSITVSHMNWDQCQGSTAPCQNVFQVSPEDAVTFIPPAAVLFEAPFFGGDQETPAVLRLTDSEAHLSQRRFGGSKRRVDLHVHSIYIPPGWAVELFSKPALQGERLVLTGTLDIASSLPDLSVVAYPDGSPVGGRVRSIRITRAGGT
jgi:surface antigen